MEFKSTRDEMDDHTGEEGDDELRMGEALWGDCVVGC